MPCVMSKPLVWNDNCRSFTSAIHEPSKRIKWEHPECPLKRGECYLNTTKIVRDMWYRVCEKETKEEFMKSIKICSGQRWLKNCNDRFVGCDKTHKDDIVNHFWVEFKGKKEYLVIDVGFEYGVEEAQLILYSVPHYYKAFNIANRVELKYNMFIAEEKVPIYVEIPNRCWNRDY